jgi:RNA polymerase sigma factor (sigma-70 family)
MSGQPDTQPVTVGSGNPIQKGLVDPEILRRLTAIIRAGLGRYSAEPSRQREAIVEEVLSETACRALEAANRYDPALGSVLHWLGGFAWNVLRERSKTKPIRMIGLDPSLPDNQPSVSEVVVNRLDAAQVLSRLPEDARQLLLWESEGWTASDIGDELGIRAATARVRLHRARILARELSGVKQTGGADHA